MSMTLYVMLCKAEEDGWINPLNEVRLERCRSRGTPKQAIDDNIKLGVNDLTIHCMQALHTSSCKTAT